MRRLGKEELLGEVLVEMRPLPKLAAEESPSTRANDHPRVFSTA